jgi:hypothetical protein
MQHRRLRDGVGARICDGDALRSAMVHPVACGERPAHAKAAGRAQLGARWTREIVLWWLVVNACAAGGAAIYEVNRERDEEREEWWQREIESR